MYYVYILLCKDKTLYTGIAKNIAARLDAHMRGKGARYTKSHRPDKIVYVEIHNTKGDALRREYALKKLSRTQKLKMINTPTHD